MKQTEKRLASLVISLLFFQPAGSAELAEGRVSEVKKDSNVASVVYKDSESGAKKKLDIAVLPESGTPLEAIAEDKAGKLKVGDKVKVRAKKNLTTGMYETSVVKAPVS